MLKLLMVVAGLTILMSSISTTYAQREGISGTVTASPLMIGLDSVPSPQEAGAGVRLTGTVQNLSTARASDVTLTLRVQPLTLGAQGGFTQVAKQIQPMRESAFSWRVCSNSPGNYVAVVRALWSDGENSFAVESNAVIVSVVDGRRACSNSFVFETSG